MLYRRTTLLTWQKVRCRYLLVVVQQLPAAMSQTVAIRSQQTRRSCTCTCTCTGHGLATSTRSSPARKRCQRCRCAAATHIALLQWVASTCRASSCCRKSLAEEGQTSLAGVAGLYAGALWCQTDGLAEPCPPLGSGHCLIVAATLSSLGIDSLGACLSNFRCACTLSPYCVSLLYYLAAHPPLSALQLSAASLLLCATQADTLTMSTMRSWA